MSHENANNKPLIRHVNRQQMSWRAVDVEQLISEDHPARAIWTLVGRLDLRRFYENIESSAEEGGRPAIDPQLLISLWVYAYSRGIGSAREIERRCEYDPAFQWLTGMEPVNYHTLADFRVERAKELDQLFSHLLGVLSAERLITLEEVMQDGTKIQAQASGKTFRREKTLREYVERARLQVEALRAGGAGGESAPASGTGASGARKTRTVGTGFGGTGKVARAEEDGGRKTRDTHEHK